MAHFFIDTLQTGQQITDFYVLNRAVPKQGKNSKYLEMELQDNSGIIRAVKWEWSESEFSSLQPGEIVKIQGVVTEYNERLELHVQRIRMAEKTDSYDESELVEYSGRDFAEMKEYFQKTIHSMQNPHLKNLLSHIFKDENFSNEFYEAPAGKKWHHCYRRGLLEHVTNMIRIGETMCLLYPDMDKDLLIVGIVFHDIGKLWEYAGNLTVDFSDSGRLNGHIALGYHFVMTKIEELDNFPEKLKMLVGHLILSHQGEYEKASPVLPQILEAVALHAIDELDAKTNAIHRLLNKDKTPGSNWTRFNQLTGRFYFDHKDNE